MKRNDQLIILGFLIANEDAFAEYLELLGIDGSEAGVIVEEFKEELLK